MIGAIPQQISSAASVRTRLLVVMQALRGINFTTRPTLAPIASTTFCECFGLILPAQ